MAARRSLNNFLTCYKIRRYLLDIIDTPYPHLSRALLHRSQTSRRLSVLLSTSFGSDRVIIRSRQSHEDLEKSRVVRSSKTSDWIPTRDRLEARAGAVGVAAVGDIVKSARVGVQHRVDEADGGLVGKETLLVDAGKDRGDDRCRSGGTTNGVWRALPEEQDVVTESTDIG